MYVVKFQLSCFDEKQHVPRNSLQWVINALCAALVEADVAWLTEHPEAPNLYESGVRYVAEPRDEEWFADIPTVLGRGFGDCDDLAAWRAAELIVRHGVEARVFTQRQVKRDGSTLYHVMVQSPLGTEDPSSALGMNWEND